MERAFVFHVLCLNLSRKSPNVNHHLTLLSIVHGLKTVPKSTFQLLFCILHFQQFPVPAFNFFSYSLAFYSDSSSIFSTATFSVPLALPFKSNALQSCLAFTWSVNFQLCLFRFNIQFLLLSWYFLRSSSSPNLLDSILVQLHPFPLINCWLHL